LRGCPRYAPFTGDGFIEGSGEVGEDFENTGDGDTEPEYKERVDRFAVEAGLCTSDTAKLRIKRAA
jgi:hypothetical protein